jgi:serine/threonine protein kinase
MAPEVFLHKHYNKTVDIFSFGIIVQEVCLSCSLPCSSPNMFTLGFNLDYREIGIQKFVKSTFSRAELMILCRCLKGDLHQGFSTQKRLP